MTDEERKEAERLAWQHVDITLFEDASWQSFIEGYEAACEAKRARLSELEEELGGAKDDAMNMAMRLGDERARSAKLAGFYSEAISALEHGGVSVSLVADMKRVLEEYEASR